MNFFRTNPDSSIPAKAGRPVRPPAVAGRFYPAEPDRLRQSIEILLGDVATPAAEIPKALIAPHAGYMYSGPIAASAFASLSRERGVIRRVVLVGPAHFVPVPGVVSSSAEAFATPLGEVPVDRAMIEALVRGGLVSPSDEAHAPEHSLEVELPFLQVVLGNFELVPLLVGEASCEQVQRVLEAAWGGPETCIVVSSDLSHYLDSEAARQLDGITVQAIERLEPDEIGPSQACGRVPIAGLLSLARSHGLKAVTADVRNSGDTAGPRHQVVGYGAFLFPPAGN